MQPFTLSWSFSLVCGSVLGKGSSGQDSSVFPHRQLFLSSWKTCSLRWIIVLQFSVGNPLPIPPVNARPEFPSGCSSPHCSLQQHLSQPHCFYSSVCGSRSDQSKATCELPAQNACYSENAVIREQWNYSVTSDTQLPLPPQL